MKLSGRPEDIGSLGVREPVLPSDLVGAELPGVSLQLNEEMPVQATHHEVREASAYVATGVGAMEHVETQVMSNLYDLGL